MFMVLPLALIMAIPTVTFPPRGSWFEVGGLAMLALELRSAKNKICRCRFEVDILLPVVFGFLLEEFNKLDMDA
jgi:hypothetical protein